MLTRLQFQPDEDPDDECGDNGSGVTSAASCEVTCYSMSATQSCSTNCQTATGCSVTPTTSTTTLSSGSYVIPTGVVDTFDFSGDADPGVASFASAQSVSEDSVVSHREAGRSKKT